MNTASLYPVACSWCNGRGSVYMGELCPACRGFEVMWGEQPACVYCSAGRRRPTPCPLCGGTGVLSTKKEVRCD